MRRFPILFGVLCAWMVPSTMTFAASAPQAKGQKTPAIQGQFTPIPLRSTRALSQDALTTERVWALDPSAVNPHRLAWVLSRDLQIEGLQAEALPEEQGFRLKADAVSASTLGFQRAPQSPYYFQIESALSCSESVEDANGSGNWIHPPFRTWEGTRLALEVASQVWEAELASKMTRLTLLLGQVRAVSGEQALALGRLIFQQWRDEVTQSWRNQVDIKARAAEWSLYLSQGKSSGLCQDGKRIRPMSPIARRTWREIMDPPKSATWSEGALSDAGATRKTLARVPTRLWKGRPVVRATVDILGKRMTGQFLLDSSAPRTLVSPQFLISQGLNPQLAERPDLRPALHEWTGGKSAGPWLRMSELEIAGYRSRMDLIGLVDTELFTPPDFISTCCDGVLGRDFISAQPLAVFPAQDLKARSVTLIYEGYHFAPSPDWSWIEIAEKDTGFWSSECEWRGVSSRGKELRQAGVHWSTVSAANEGSWGKEPAAAVGRLECHGQEVAEGVALQEALLLTSEKRVSSRPSASVGLDLLGRGAFVFDIGHGRLWYTKNAWEHPEAQLLQTQAGLHRSGGPAVDIAFDFARDADVRKSPKSGLSLGDRILLITGLNLKTPLGKSLAADGAHSGSRVRSIDGKSSDEWDLWQVQERLKGRGGTRVELEIETRKSVLKKSFELVQSQ